MAAPGPCTCHDRRCASNLPQHRCWQKANDGRLSAWQPKQNRIAFVLQPGSGRSEEGRSGRHTRELPWNLIWASSEMLVVGERRFWDNCIAESERCLKEGIFHYSTRVTSNFLPPSSVWMAGARAWFTCQPSPGESEVLAGGLVPCCLVGPRLRQKGHLFFCTWMECLVVV